MLSFFANGAAADSAAQSIQDTGSASGDAIGILVLDAIGNLKIDKARIAADLGAGKAAVGVLASIEDAPAVRAALTGLGGATSGHDVVDETAVQAAQQADLLHAGPASTI